MLINVVPQRPGASDAAEAQNLFSTNTYLRDSESPCTNVISTKTSPHRKIQQRLIILLQFTAFGTSMGFVLILGIALSVYVLKVTNDSRPEVDLQICVQVIQFYNLLNGVISQVLGFPGGIFESPKKGIFTSFACGICMIGFITLSFSFLGGLIQYYAYRVMFSNFIAVGLFLWNSYCLVAFYDTNKLPHMDINISRETFRIVLPSFMMFFISIFVNTALVRLIFFISYNH
eukprot:TRINITY_DN16284_c0_g1::TRINITY_DN16284_c0_g1_i1::g.3099::m.3099 TRINITY_DN16284_c0_g1::TRINITY_DN16284_c0_g1_i1::g.3099  ORF type:complete len:231 (-),score=14.46 TRINITY_DN16284_c0_g1_i1:297-989(-)